MIRRLSLIIVLLMSLAGGLAHAQTITPVDNDPAKPQQPTLHYYDKHGNPLPEPVLFLAELDTVSKASPKPVYPLLESMSFGVNFFDGVMMLAGQKHASIDFWGSLSLYNWVQPVVELGVGWANNRPEEGNFHYIGKPSVYAKIGADYNFLYKSDPAYQLHFGLRAGYSHFSYDIKDITISSSYWDQTNSFNLSGQKAHALFGEVLAGLRVKIWKSISMGWDVRLRFKMKVTDGRSSTPWFVPGYGTGSLVSGSFSLIWTMPLASKKGVAELAGEAEK